MWAMRTRLERMSLMRYRDLIESKRFTDHIHNGHILVYTRINPETGEIAPNFRCDQDRILAVPKGISERDACVGFHGSKALLLFLGDGSSRCCFAPCVCVYSDG
jgi:hypothetical protein